MKQLLFSLGIFISFSLMNGQNVIFHETFDAVPEAGLPFNWNSVDLDNDGVGWMVVDDPSLTSSMGFSGKICYSYGQNAHDNVLSLPAINIPAASTLTFLMASFTDGGTLPADSHYAVYVLPAATAFTTTAIPVLEETVSTGDVAVSKTLNLSNYAGQNVRVFFRLFNSTFHTLILDNVKITQNLLETSEVTKTAGIKIYPNPATDFIQVKSKSEILDVKIYDRSGKIIKTQWNNKKIDVRNFLIGDYFIRINTNEGIICQKFIKK